MSYVIAIPSFKRSDTLINRTLNTLCTVGNIKQEDIYVFVADNKEYDEYRAALQNSPYPNVTVVKGVRGIPNQRNYIQKFFQEGEHLVMVDDDIYAIRVLNRYNKREDLRDIDGYIKRCFAFCKRYRVNFWGINSTDNFLEMKHAASHGFIYIVGNFIGMVNTHDPEVMVDEGKLIPARKYFEAGKESHERAIKFFLRDGAIIKFRNAGVISKYWGEAGGHQVSRTPKGEGQATDILCSIYGGLINKRLYKGIPDITFKTKTKVIPFQL